MDQNALKAFLLINSSYLFPNGKYPVEYMIGRLENTPPNLTLALQKFPFRKPSTVQLISVLTGMLGIDRFYLGQIATGTLKYFSFGGLGIWWIIDIITATKRCRKYNCKKLLAAIENPSVITALESTDAQLRKAGNISKEILKGVGYVKFGIGANGKGTESYSYEQQQQSLPQQRGDADSLQTGEGFVDASGFYRYRGEGFVDASGFYRYPSEGFVDASGFYRDPGEGFVDASGFYRDPDEGFVDASGVWRAK